MRRSLVVAMARNRVIGRDNALPWRLPADLAHFKKVTMGRPITMGRRTHESIGRPLPGRENIVVTRNRGFQAPGCIVVASLEAAWKAAGDAEEAYVIGGTSLFEGALHKADGIHLTTDTADHHRVTSLSSLPPIVRHIIVSALAPATVHPHP